MAKLEQTKPEKRKLEQNLKAVKKLLPLLRKKDFKGSESPRRWTYEELANRTASPVAVVKQILKEFEQRTGAHIDLLPNQVCLRGPKRIDLKKPYTPGASPCTPLALTFRKHGVKLEGNLTPQTTYCQENMADELVLTLEQSMIRMANGVMTYESENDSRFEAHTKRKAGHSLRIRLLLAAMKKNNLRVRVIETRNRDDDKLGEKIEAQSVDDHYWRIVRVDPISRRFAVERTKEVARIYPLHETE